LVIALKDQSEFVVLLNIIFLLSNIVAIGQITLEIVLEQCNFELIAHEEDPEEILKQNLIRKNKKIAI
jgi:hypothetical protein